MIWRGTSTSTYSPDREILRLSNETHTFWAKPTATPTATPTTATVRKRRRLATPSDRCNWAHGDYTATSPTTPPHTPMASQTLTRHPHGDALPLHPTPHTPTRFTNTDGYGDATRRCHAPALVYDASNGAQHPSPTLLVAVTVSCCVASRPQPAGWRYAFFPPAAYLHWLRTSDAVGTRQGILALQPECSYGSSCTRRRSAISGCCRR